MNIVIISPFQKIMPRGIERFCYSLANAMGQMGHQVIIYAWKSKNEFSWGDLHHNVKIKECPSFRYYQRAWIANYYNMLLSKDKPDAVLLNFLYHGELQLSKRWNYTYVLHSPASQIKNRYGFIKNNIKKFKNLKFVAVSNMVKQEAEPFLEGRQCEVIFNGVDLKLFTPKLKNGHKSKLKIITASALEERKGIQFVIRAIANYQNKEKIDYQIYGNGSYEKELLTLIRKLELEDIVTLNSPVTNLNEVLREFDLFALLSKGEAFPIAPLEAMASGLPLLVSDYEPYSEFIKSDFGFMLSPEDKTSIHKVFDLMIDDSLIKNQMNLNSRKAALEFCWSSVSEKYTKYIN